MVRIDADELLVRGELMDGSLSIIATGGVVVVDFVLVLVQESQSSCGIAVIPCLDKSDWISAGVKSDGLGILRIHALTGEDWRALAVGHEAADG